MASDEFLTAEQIALELDVNLQTIQRHFRDGSLPGRKIGHRWRTTRTALNAWVAGTPGVSSPTIETPALPPLEKK